MYFRNFVIISPWKRAESFIWTNLNPPHPNIICAKIGWNWPSGSGEDDFLNSSMYFRNFVIISPWKRGASLHLNKLESPSPKNSLKLAQWFWGRWFFNFYSKFSQLSPLRTDGALLMDILNSLNLMKDDLCQIWLKLPQCFWRRRFFKSIYFCNFVIISPGKRTGSFIWTNLNSLHLRMLCAKFGLNWPTGSGDEDENVKRFTTTTTTTNFDQKSSLEPSAQVS